MKAAHGFSDAQYGAIYLPQLVAAVVGAVGGGYASNHWTLKQLFLLSLGLFLAAQLLLALSTWPGYSLSMNAALLAVMAATAAFGLGFGIGGGPLNGLVAQLFPKSPNTAIAALHMCAGAGLTLAPVFFAGLAGIGHWEWCPVSLGVVTTTILALSLRATFPRPEPVAKINSTVRTPGRDRGFWVLALAAVSYALVEGTFSNWAALYVHDDLHFPPSVAAAALTSFWGALTLGRLLASVLALRVKPLWFLILLPFFMIAALLVVRSSASPQWVLLGFGLAGLACSAFFPMLVGFAAEESPQNVSWIAAMLTAALMCGVGIASYVIGALRTSLGIRQPYGYAMAYPVAALLLILLCSHWRRHRSTTKQ